MKIESALVSIQPLKDTSMALGLFLYHKEVMRLAQLVEKFVGNITLSSPAQQGMMYGAFLSSHPKDSYDEAKAYIERQAEHPNFSRGHIEKVFLTPSAVEESRSVKEDSAFDEDGEAIDLVGYSQIVQEDQEEESRI